TMRSATVSTMLSPTARSSPAARPGPTGLRRAPPPGLVRFSRRPSPVAIAAVYPPRPLDRRSGEADGPCYTAAMKRSLQEVVELVVFGLIALLIGTGLLWLVGWILSLGGIVLKAIAGLLWLLLRFVVPVANVTVLAIFLD